VLVYVGPRQRSTRFRRLQMVSGVHIEEHLCTITPISCTHSSYL
jgi:hypothetical protein